MAEGTIPIALVMATVAAACAVPGVFLLLRRVTLVGDAISHVLLLGIVLAFLVVRDLASPWLLIGAAMTGVLTVALVELLQHSNRVKADAAIGLVFPAMFSLGTVLASMFLRNTHLDIDRVLLGSAELAPLDSVFFNWSGTEYAIPRSAIVMAVLAALNTGLVILFFKELKLATFDPALAAALGFRPGWLHYALMTLVSLTIVAAFDAVGPVLVVAFLAVPAAMGFLLTDRLGILIVLSVFLAVFGATLGTGVAVKWDLNVAGTAATVLGLMFAVVWLVAPERGLIARGFRRWRQRRTFHETMLAIHLFQHEGTPAERDESRLDGLHRHLRWEPAQVTTVVHRASRHGLIVTEGELLRLTETGRTRAREVLGAG